MKLLKWITLLLVAAGFFYLTPVIEFLGPDKNTLLVMYEEGAYVFLASGVGTLWYHWQSWGYIFLFCVFTALYLGWVYKAIRFTMDEDLTQAKKDLIEKTRDLERIKKEYCHQVEQQLRTKYAAERRDLIVERREVEARQVEAWDQEAECRRILHKAEQTAKRQQQETQTKLKQRDRLRAEKKMMVEFFNNRAGLEFNDGSKVTYASLLKLAKRR